MSAIISGLICLIIYGTMRFYADWFNSSQMTTILGGFVGSWLFLFELTAISNFEMFAFGDDFASKFFPEVLICLTMAAVASSVIHRVCMTTWWVIITNNNKYFRIIISIFDLYSVLFSLLVLYFLDRISNEHYNKTYSRLNQEAQYLRRPGGAANIHIVSGNPSNHQSGNAALGGSRRRK